MIRKATLNDFVRIKNLISILEDKEYDEKKMFEIYKKHLETDKYKYFVYEEEKIIGMISFLIKETLHHNSLTGEIIELCILPEYRNKGIGEKLLKYIERLAVEYNLTELELSINMKRKDAHRFYERHHYIKDHYNFTKSINH